MPNRVCTGCGQEFVTRDTRRTRCRKDCGRERTSQQSHTARTARRAAHAVTFVGVDGEGINLPNGEHRYVLLSVGTRSYHRNGAQLQFPEIMEFLWSCFQDNPTATYVGFFLGYDFTQWLRTLPENRAWYLLSKQGRNVLYNAGEESKWMIKLRADRLGVAGNFALS